MLGAMGSEGLSQSSLLYRLTDRLPVRTALLVAVQHVLAMFVGVITVPLLVAQSLRLPPNETGLLVSMGLIASGLGTLVQVHGFGVFGSRLLAVQGTSFTFLVPLIQAGQVGGLPLMLGMSLLCAPVELVLAQFLATAGIRILQRVQLGHRELLVLAFSLGVGIGVQTVAELLDPLPESVRLVFSSGITTGGIPAFVRNTVLPSQTRKAAVKGSTGATAEPLSGRPSGE